MPLPKNRSTSVRKIHKRLPRGGSTIHYRRREKGKTHSCAISGDTLQAVTSQQGTNSSARHPNRKFGGALSSAISSRILRIASRVQEGALSLSEVDVRMLPYVKRLIGSK